VKALQETGKLARFGWSVGSAVALRVKSSWAVWQTVLCLKEMGITYQAVPVSKVELNQHTYLAAARRGWFHPRKREEIK
jgi:hypothetical protein